MTVAIETVGSPPVGLYHMVQFHTCCYTYSIIYVPDRQRTAVFYLQSVKMLPFSRDVCECGRPWSCRHYIYLGVGCFVTCVSSYAFLLFHVKDKKLLDSIQSLMAHALHITRNEIRRVKWHIERDIISKFRRRIQNLNAKTEVCSKENTKKSCETPRNIAN